VKPRSALPQGLAQEQWLAQDVITLPKSDSSKALSNSCLRAFGSAPLDTVTDARSSRLVVGLVKHLDFTGAADKAANLVGCQSPHHQLPGRVVSMSDACGGNEACSART